MRRWIMMIAAMLTVAALAAAALPLTARSPRPSGGSTPMAAMGLVLLEDDAGLYVLGVADDSPARSAGIHPGDRLTALRDTALTTVAQLETLLNDPEQGGDVPLTLSRYDQTVTVRLSLP